MGEYDLVVRGGTIVDGTGVARYCSDIAVSNGRIAKISGRSHGAVPKRSMLQGASSDPEQSTSTPTTMAS